MTFRFPLFLFLSFFFITLAQSQINVNPAIQAKLDAFIAYSNQKEWDKAFDLLYPKLFTQVSKQELIDIMHGSEMEGMDIAMANTKIVSSSMPLTEGQETFVRLDYVSDLTVRIKEKGMYDAPKAIQSLNEQFVAVYGKENVKWNADLKSFAIHANKSMMAVDPGDMDWKLVEINTDQPELLAFLFSPTVLDQLVKAK